MVSAPGPYEYGVTCQVSWYLGGGSSIATVWAIFRAASRSDFAFLLGMSRSSGGRIHDMLPGCVFNSQSYKQMTFGTFDSAVQNTI